MIPGTGQFSRSYRAVAAVFVNPGLCRVQLAWAAVSFATWTYAIALGVYAFDVGGATAVGLVALVRLLPGALASPFAGVLGDRHSRRALLIASSLAGATVLAASAWATAMSAPAAIVFTLAGLFTVVSSAYVPAEGSLMPLVARTPQELSAANVAHSAMDNLGFLGGSVVTGVLLTTTSPQVAFGAAAALAALAAFVLVGVRPDERPDYVHDSGLSGALRQTRFGFRSLWTDPPMRLLGSAFTILVFFEGAADVLVVVVALQLLGLAQGSVGYLNAAWGVGALVGGAVLALLLHRGNLSAGLVVGALVAGVAMALPGAWPVVVAAYAGWIGMGIGYTFVEVSVRTLLQRLGSDEVLGRVLGFLETSRLAAMALGSIAAPALVALLGIRGSLVALGAILPLFAFTRWRLLRQFEAGTPVPERFYSLLRTNSIFAPLPVATLERLCGDLEAIDAEPGKEIVTQGEHGRRFFLIDQGEVEIYRDGVRRHVEGEGGSFGEIALLRDVPRTATVRATCRTRMLALERERFLAAVTGHVRSHQAARAVVDSRLPQAPEG
ncbi:MAG TPA: MFS transporter [Solirubrobacterales bacterium]|nr:MFS transporter [Solirubrobacterales bacterium]